MAKNSPAGWDIPDYVKLIGIGYTSFYKLSPALQPRSVRFGKRRRIVEPPDEYLQRIAHLQEQGAAEAA